MSGIAFCWYFHLPAMSTPIEVSDHANGSLRLLLNAHERAGKPLLLAPTGTFLELCHAHEPEVLDEVRRLTETGLVEIAATYLTETDPRMITHLRAGELIERDLDLKERVLGSSPQWFVPGNFAWMAGTERHLSRLGIRAALLDGRQLREETSVRTWHWDDDGAVRPGRRTTRGWEQWLRTKGHIEFRPGEKNLVVAFRDWPATRSTTFGSQGAIHSRDPASAVRSIMPPLVARHGLTVIADDGDRVRGQSRKGYELLLDSIDRVDAWTIPSQPPRILTGGLSTYFPPGVAELLHGTEDAVSYWKLLGEVDAGRLTAVEHDQLLKFHDVFYAYWPDVARRADYVGAVLDLLESQMTPSQDRRNHG